MSAQRAVLLLTLYLLLTANWPLWLSLARIAQGQGDVLSLGVPMLGLLASATLAVLGVTAWSRGMRWLWWLLLLVAALAQYYMLTYRVVMDPGMLTNVMQTDVRETRDLLTARLP